MMSILQTCPCLNSNILYHDCCQPLHNGSKHAESAVQLMRSRYSAFCLTKVDYLIATLHPDKRQADDKVVLNQTILKTQWLGLKIIHHSSTKNNASVEFVAFYQDPEMAQLHEISHFIKENGHWFYLDGEFLPAIKLTRNEPCFCGSSKKVKKCHHSAKK